MMVIDSGNADDNLAKVLTTFEVCERGGCILERKFAIDDRMDGVVF